jgi:hypothetical protein
MVVGAEMWIFEVYNGTREGTGSQTRWDTS